MHAQLTAVHAVAARVAIRRGDLDHARTHVGLAARNRPLCFPDLPFSAVFLLQLAQAYIALADPAGTRAVLRQIHDVLASATRPRCDRRSVRGVAWQARRGQPSARRRVLVVGSRASTRAAAVHAPHLQGDRRSSLCIAEHDQVGDVIDLQETGCLVTKRSGESRRAARPPRAGSADRRARHHLQLSARSGHHAFHPDGVASSTGSIRTIAP